VTAEPTARLEVVADAPRPFRPEGLGYVYEPPGLDVRLRVDYLQRRAEDLTGEIVVEATLPGVPSHLHQARFNLVSTTARETLARHLMKKTPGEYEGSSLVPWGDVLEQLCTSVLRAVRQGEPFLRVGRRPPRERERDLVTPLLIANKATVLYGPGSHCKGWVAVACSVCVTAGVRLAGMAVQQGEVLYLDWEDDEDVLDMRVKQISRGLELPEPVELHYRACRGPLRYQVHQVAAHISKHSIRLVVVDSVQMAAGSVGERGSYEERAQEFFEALRQLGKVTALCIDHVSKEGKRNQQGTSDPYGSIFKVNWARLMWEVRKDQDFGRPISRLGLYHAKGNHGPELPPIGLVLDFSQPDRVVVRRDDVQASADLVGRLPLHQQITLALRDGPLTDLQLASLLNVKPNVIRAEVSRRRKFERLPYGRVSLAEDAAAPEIGPEHAEAEEMDADDAPDQREIPF
jgi:hypothetical protein